MSFMNFSSEKSENCFNKIWAVLRMFLGFIFLWPFMDKLLGLGFATCFDDKAKVFLGYMCKAAWISGGSPTAGFLKFGTKGPLAGIFQSMAGSDLVAWLFMAGLLGVGLALILGVAARVAAVSGIAMLLLMYMAKLWPDNNPILDEHIIYSVVLLAFMAYNPSKTWGLGKWWANTALVKKYTCLE